MQNYSTGKQPGRKKEDVLRAHPNPCYIGAWFTDLRTQPILAGCVERIQGRKKASMIYEGPTALTSNHGTQRRPLTTSLHGAGQGKRGDTKQ